jgi:signal transduction histidine kinase
MVITADPNTLVSDKRAVLEVLAGQVAIGIESAILIEQKLRLERELAGRERLAALGQMAATVAHEVKNPLSAIKSIAQVMREDRSLAAAYTRDLDLIIGEINRLSSTVSQLLAFSRSGSRRAPGGAPVQLQDDRLQDVRLQDMIGSALAVLRADAENRDVQLDVTGESNCSLTGQEADALREVLINLVLNAVQASPDHGRVSINTNFEAGRSARGNACVARSAQQTGVPESTDELQRGASRGLLELSVSDEGPGISAEDQTRIFEPFYTTKPRGTGLGLAIVQRRINDIKGKLDIVSPGTGGRGATFIVSVSLES